MRGGCFHGCRGCSMCMPVWGTGRAWSRREREHGGSCGTRSASDIPPPRPSPLITEGIAAHAWVGWCSCRSSMPMRYGLALCPTDKDLMNYGLTTRVRPLDVLAPKKSHAKPGVKMEVTVHIPDTIGGWCCT